MPRRVTCLHFRIAQPPLETPPPKVVLPKVPGFRFALSARALRPVSLRKPAMLGTMLGVRLKAPLSARAPSSCASRGAGAGAPCSPPRHPAQLLWVCMDMHACIMHACECGSRLKTPQDSVAMWAKLFRYFFYNRGPRKRAQGQAKDMSSIP